MKQRGFAPILILLVVVLLIGGAYYFGTIKKDKAPTVSASPSPVGMSILDITKKYHAKDYAGKLYNNAPATQMVAYKNEAAGISFDVPYNPNWGIDAIHPLPYDESFYFDGTFNVLFGPIHAYCGEGDFDCKAEHWSRDFSMRIYPLKTKEAMLQELKKIDEASSPGEFEYSEVQINNLTVIRSIARGLGDDYRNDVFGNKYIYSFNSGGEDSEELFTKIIESIKLLD